MSSSKPLVPPGESHPCTFIWWGVYQCYDTMLCHCTIHTNHSRENTAPPWAITFNFRIPLSLLPKWHMDCNI